MIVGALAEVLAEAGGIWRAESPHYRFKLIMGLDHPLLSVHRRGSKAGDVILRGVAVVVVERVALGVPVLYVRTGLGIWPVAVPGHGWMLDEQEEE